MKAFYCINKDLSTSLVFEQPVCERALCVTLIFDLQLYHLQKRQLGRFSWHGFGILFPIMAPDNDVQIIVLGLFFFFYKYVGFFPPFVPGL